MKTLARIGVMLALFCSALNVYAQPLGVGAAEVLPGFCLFNVVIETTSTTPSYKTVAVVVDVEDNQFVATHSKNGNANLNCSGNLDGTSPVVGTDALVMVGQQVEGLPLPRDEACSFLESLGVNACKGNAGGASTGFENTGLTCNLPTEGGIWASTNWRQLTTPSGRLKLYCHFNSNKDTFVPLP